MKYDCFSIYEFAAKNPDKLAIFDGRVSLSYRELCEHVDRLAAGMSNRGVKKGDRILIGTPNFAEFLIIMFACVKLGAVLVCCNMQFKDQELNYLGGLLGQPKLAFMNRQVQMDIVQAQFPELEVVSIQEEEPLTALSAYYGAADSCPESSFSEDNDMLIVFTSGSTGVPKGVELTVGNMLIPMQDMISRFHADENEVLYVPVPFCQTAGIAGILIALLVGGSIVTGTRFNGEEALELIEKYHVSLQFCVTTMYAREIEAYENADPKPDISCLRTGTIGGGPVVRDYMVWFEEHFDCRLLNFYGMTEVAGMIVGDFEDTQYNRLNRIGLPCPHVTVKIMDDSGEEVPYGTEGEICCKSPGVTRGYFKNPEMTAALLDEKGWLHSGDIGRMDPDGYVTITGRKKEMLIRGGYNVFPAELENLYYGREDVLLAAMVPFYGGEFGEKIAVVLQLKEGYSAQESEMIDYARSHLAKFKVPDRVLFMEKMPLLPSNKVDKVTLKKLVKDLV